MSIYYKGVQVALCKIDFVIARRLVLEIKAIDAIHTMHRLQARTYMRLVSETIALIINFNVPVLKEGINHIIESGRFRAR